MPRPGGIGFLPGGPPRIPKREICGRDSFRVNFSKLFQRGQWAGTHLYPVPSDRTRVGDRGNAHGGRRVKGGPLIFSDRMGPGVGERWLRASRSLSRGPILGRQWAPNLGKAGLDRTGYLPLGTEQKRGHPGLSLNGGKLARNTEGPRLGPRRVSPAETPGGFMQPFTISGGDPAWRTKKRCIPGPETCGQVRLGKPAPNFGANFVLGEKRQRVRDRSGTLAPCSKKGPVIRPTFFYSWRAGCLTGNTNLERQAA